MEKSDKNQELTVAIVLYKEDFDLIFKTLDIKNKMASIFNRFK